MVSGRANSNNLLLVQQKMDENSSEITAIPKLLRVSELRRIVATIYATDYEKLIAQQILDKVANYISAVEENQFHLLEGMRDSFKCCCRKRPLKKLIAVRGGWEPTSAGNSDRLRHSPALGN